jgi:hypothetical protein
MSSGTSALSLVIISGRLCTPGGREGMPWRRAAAMTVTSWTPSSAAMPV